MSNYPAGVTDDDDHFNLPSGRPYGYVFPPGEVEDNPEAYRTHELSFESVKSYLRNAFKSAEPGSYEELYYCNGFTEMILIQRDMELAQLCTRHSNFRFEGSMCAKCVEELRESLKTQVTIVQTLEAFKGKQINSLA